MATEDETKPHKGSRQGQTLLLIAGQPNLQYQQMQQMMTLVPGLGTITAAALQTALQTLNLACGEVTLEQKLEALGNLVEFLTANSPAQVH